MSDVTAADPAARPSLFTWTEGIRSHGAPIRDSDIVTWVLTEGHRAASIAELLDKTCWRLVGEGVPLWRALLSIGTLHPQFLGFSALWRRDRDMVEELEVSRAATGAPEYLDSPMRPAMECGETVRYRLDVDEIGRYPLLLELKAEGATDYLACPLTLFGDRHHVVTFATDHAGGFSDSDRATIDRVLPALAVVAEGKAMRRLTANVLGTYLGLTIGRHILNGEIERRRGEDIRAALLATDLRGFTALSDQLPAEALIELLDDYFDAVTSPIHAHGGEVLKFVGDGALAIFPIEASDKAAARSALAAAQEALGRLDALNVDRRAAKLPLIRIGIGLHVGTVFYGNVGAVDRLDFTAIGPAVNLACRLESLTKRLDRPLLVSQEFAALIGHPLESLGFHPVRGFSEPEEVFALPSPREA